jgi:hypothetical protein
MVKFPVYFQDARRYLDDDTNDKVEELEVCVIPEIDAVSFCTLSDTEYDALHVVRADRVPLDATNLVAAFAKVQRIVLIGPIMEMLEVKP